MQKVTMHTDALLRHIIEHPDDTDARMVYADALEEAGDGERAEFIRVQCELAQVTADYACNCAPYHGNTKRPCEVCKLRRRERELCETLIPSNVCTYKTLWAGPAANLLLPPGNGYVFRRGFIERIACHLHDWVKRGPAIARTHPVTEVSLVDMHPWNSGNHRWGWSKGAHDAQFGSFWILPDGIFDCLPPTDNGLPENRMRRWYKWNHRAIDALSAACLRWARAQEET